MGFLRESRSIDVNFELRWVVPAPGVILMPGRLQIRFLQEVGPANALGRGKEWSPWIDVPTVVLEGS